VEKMEESAIQLQRVLLATNLTRDAIPEVTLLNVTKNNVVWL
jgi:hypothetical protein